jgi:hypothetical protein
MPGRTRKMGMKDKKLLSKQGIDPVPPAFKASVLPHFPDERDRPCFTYFQGKFNVRCTIGATLHYYRIWNMDGRYSTYTYAMSTRYEVK